MPEPETPDTPADEPMAGDPMRGLVDEAVGRGMPVDAGTIEMAAVETGPEVRTRKRKGLGFSAWLSIAWLVIVVGAAILAPWLPIDDPKAITTDIARRGPFADAGARPVASWAATSTAVTCSRASSGVVAPPSWSRRSPSSSASRSAECSA